MWRIMAEMLAHADFASLTAAQQLIRSLASNIGSQYQAAFRQAGQTITNEAIMRVAEAVPFPFRAMIVTRAEYEAAKKRESVVPEWMKTTLSPIVIPLSEGAKEEAKRRAKIITPRALATVSILVLTIFSIGYIVGTYKAKRRIIAT